MSNTNLSFSIFGKELVQITKGDLDTYFAEAKEESNILEFKSFPEFLNNAYYKEAEKAILKSLSGFLNSDGGILIWGAPEGKHEEGFKEKRYKTPLTFVPALYEKDSFITKVFSRITPAPRNVYFHRIEHDGKYIYIFEVAASEFSPHQFDNTYYMRMDGQTVPAPHHYIEALFKKISFPKLEAYLRIDKYTHLGDHYAELVCTVIFRNESRYQNDLNLHFKADSIPGRIVDITAISNMQSHGIIEGSNYSVPKLADVIYYGNYLHHSFKIISDRDNLHSLNYELELTIIFGARYSPMKMCNYTRLLVLNDIHICEKVIER